MSAALVISSLMASRGHAKLARRLLEPRYMIPAAIGGGAGAYWLHNKMKDNWGETQGDRTEGFVRRHPIAVGATAGGIAMGGLGALAIHKLLKKIRKHQENAPKPLPQMPPISIQIGDQTPVQEAPVEQIKQDNPSALGALLRAYGQLGGQAASAGGRGLWSALKGLGRGTRWAGGQAKRYSGVGQVEAEHAVRNQILKDPALNQHYATLASHMAQRGIAPKTGLGGWLLNPGGAIGRHYSAAGRTGWDIEQLGNPEFTKKLLHQADPKVHAAVKALQGIQMQVGGKAVPALGHLQQQAGSGWLVPTVLAGTVAAPLIVGDKSRDVRIAAPGSPGARRGMLQQGADAAGGWIGENLSPTVGNWVQQHPYASTGIAGGGLAGAGVLGYRALGGGQ